jgi:hypothetical protein
MPIRVEGDIIFWGDAFSSKFIIFHSRSIIEKDKDEINKQKRCM